MAWAGKAMGVTDPTDMMGVTGPTDFMGVATGVAPSTPTLWTWGDNSGISATAGMLGHGDLVHRSSPVQVGSLETYSQGDIGGYHMGVVKTDSSLWMCGEDDWGQLGLGVNGARISSPVQVGGLTTWALAVVGMFQQSAGIKTDGTLWAWGLNNYGELGTGNTTHYSSPVQVGGLSNWSKVRYNSYDGTIALKTDNTIWSWGRNNFGQLGVNDTTDRSSPTQIGVLTTWASIAAGYIHFAAIKNDNTLWTWGYNHRGQTGHGDVVTRSSPVQVGNLSDWASVASQGYWTIAIKTDGTMWAWGLNDYGNLGQGNITRVSSPVQIGSLTTWSKVEAGEFHWLALKTDSTLWTCGYNYRGALGLGDVVPISSPVQVGSLTTWASVFAGKDSSGGIDT